MDPNGQKPVVITDPLLGQAAHAIIEEVYSFILKGQGATDVRIDLSIEDPTTGEKISSLRPDIVAYKGFINEVYEIKQGMTWGVDRKYYQKGIDQISGYIDLVPKGVPGRSLMPIFQLPFPALGPKAFLNVYPGPNGMLYYYADDGDNRKKNKEGELERVPVLERNRTKYAVAGGAALVGGYAVYRIGKLILAIVLAPDSGGLSLVLIATP